MTPGLGMGAFGTGVRSVELLIFIIQTAQKVKRLKRECDEVRLMAEILKQCLEQNTTVLKDQEAARKLETVLEEVAKFVVECQQGGVFARAWEVLWKQRLPQLLKEMMTFIAILNLGATVSMNSDLWRFMTRTDDTHAQQKTHMEEIFKKLEILDELKKEMDRKPSSRLEINFPESDTRLSVRQEQEGDVLSGELINPDVGDDATTVVCEPVKQDIMRYGETGPRQILIYSHIAANTLVHPFYGIAERSGKLWAVMKDLRGSPDLAASIQSGNYPRTVPERIAVAHSIAKTVAYLHSVEVLVKRLSDRMVLLCSGDGKITPYLTDLEQARLFKEHTSGGEYDVRYEAPEFQKLPEQQHSIYTDIWSLGILIWECVSGTFPFEFAHEITKGEEAARIRTLVSRGQLPWSNKAEANPQLRQVVRLVKRCCAFRANIRPSAADVAHSLFDIMTLAALNIDSVPPGNENVKARVSDKLDKVDKKAKQPTLHIEPSLQVPEGDVEILEFLVANGDPTAAFLLGSAIWYGLTQAGDHFDEFMLVVGQEHSDEVRARRAIPHLEFALGADIKAAAEPLTRAHQALAELYKIQARQHWKMGSIPVKRPSEKGSHSD